ncbi:hypothetical protein BD779DRAFT_1468887 [Infundibulicybe gibba]|nr:hypothetical protein BD779DRAFT_1468887 [Infundibulicybe gibba]
MRIYYEPFSVPGPPRCLLAVGAVGTIEWIVDDVESTLIQEVLTQKGCIDNADVEIIELPRGQFIMPGLVDTHTRVACATIPESGSGQQYELLDWLKHITFPMEANFNDPAFARRTYEAVVRQVIGWGCNLRIDNDVLLLGSFHLKATKILADIVHAKGQRAFIGLTELLQNCNMDRNPGETYVEPSFEDSIHTTKKLISHIRSLSHTSRASHNHACFAMFCTRDLLKELGKLAACDHTLAIQTHISENASEIARTKKLFPECSTYADIYDSFGLLRANTVLAHAVHLEDAEVELIAKRRAGISHCPTSNFNLSSGVAPIGKYLDRGIKMGLGTDVSAGFSPSILNSIQSASIAAKVIAMKHEHPEPGKIAGRMLKVSELLHLATLGGAQVCCLEAETGSFAPGKSFDALVVDVSGGLSPGVWGADSDGPTNMLERFLFCGDDRNIAKVYVRGRLIGGRHFRHK